MPIPILIGSIELYFSENSISISTASSTKINSLIGFPEPYSSISFFLISTAFANLAIRLDITCEFSGSNLSNGPYKLGKIKFIVFNLVSLWKALAPIILESFQNPYASTEG